jgi:hypothetical protein
VHFQSRYFQLARTRIQSCTTGPPDMSPSTRALLSALGGVRLMIKVSLVSTHPHQTHGRHRGITNRSTLFTPHTALTSTFRYAVGFATTRRSITLRVPIYSMIICSSDFFSNLLLKYLISDLRLVMHSFLLLCPGVVVCASPPSTCSHETSVPPKFQRMPILDVMHLSRMGKISSLQTEVCKFRVCAPPFCSSCHAEIAGKTFGTPI